MQLFYEGDFEAATLNGNEILQLRQLTQLRDGRFFSIQLPGGSQVMPSDDIPPSRTPISFYLTSIFYWAQFATKIRD